MLKHFPVNFITAPLIADLFLLAISAIGRKEVHDGTVGADHIYPIDVMVFFITLAYIAISVDASGLIRWLSYKVLQKGGRNGRLLYFYLYLFFFVLASFIGNDPIVLSGTPFLSYMTRVSSNIKEPKAWIYMQFAMANVGSAILVSSNPTNLILAGAFRIKFIVYTANVVVPVIATVAVLLPFLLWMLFRNERLIPPKIELHELPPDRKQRTPVNPNIPFGRGVLEESENSEESEESNLESIEEVLNPYLDRKSATAGAVIMAATLVTILVINAADKEEHPAFWVTLPAAVLMFSWDVWSGWSNRHETREIARKGRQAIEDKHRRRGRGLGVVTGHGQDAHSNVKEDSLSSPLSLDPSRKGGVDVATSDSTRVNAATHTSRSSSAEQQPPMICSNVEAHKSSEKVPDDVKGTPLEPVTLVSCVQNSWQWLRATFPAATVVLSHLPLPLVPFALCMFVLVQGLVSRGWVQLFAIGWDRWIEKTGTVGAVGGMGFLSVVLCNVCIDGHRPYSLTSAKLSQFAGTNIGTAILLSRIIQSWVKMHENTGVPITERTFWATIYSMTIGLNYGAFSTAFSASLAGLLWREILARKNIGVGSLDFARTNVPIIAVTMVVASAVLIGEVYIVRGQKPYDGG